MLTMVSKDCKSNTHRDVVVSSSSSSSDISNKLNNNTSGNANTTAMVARLKFARQLAANEVVVRERAVRKLTRWLSKRDHVGEDEMMKLWKALFYCFWHSDKPLVQEELARNLASLQLALSMPSLSVLFLRTFLRTMAREWAGVDRLRLDKFFNLLNEFIMAAFRLCAEYAWDNEIISCVMEEYRMYGLGIGDIRMSEACDSMYLKHTEALLPALSREVLVDGVMSIPMNIIVDSMINVLVATKRPIMIKRIVDAFFTPLIDLGMSDISGSRDDEEEDEDEKLSPILTRSLDWGKVAAVLLEGASHASTPQSNRTALYTIRSKVMELIICCKRIADEQTAMEPLHKKKTKKRRVGDEENEGIVGFSSDVVIEGRGKKIKNAKRDIKAGDDIKLKSIAATEKETSVEAKGTSDKITKAATEKIAKATIAAQKKAAGEAVKQKKEAEEAAKQKEEAEEAAKQKKECEEEARVAAAAKKAIKEAEAAKMKSDEQAKVASNLEAGDEIKTPKKKKSKVTSDMVTPPKKLDYISPPTTRSRAAAKQVSARLAAEANSGGGASPALSSLKRSRASVSPKLPQVKTTKENKKLPSGAQTEPRKTKRSRSDSLINDDDMVTPTRKKAVKFNFNKNEVKCYKKGLRMNTISPMISPHVTPEHGVLKVRRHSSCAADFMRAS